MLEKFSPKMTTLVAADDLIDLSGDDQEMFIPAGTVMEVISVESDDHAIVSATGKIFSVFPQECKEAK